RATVVRCRDDLAVVDGEGNTEDILHVADEAAGGMPGVEIPEAELAVPRARKCELAVRGDGNGRGRPRQSCRRRCRKAAKANSWLPVRKTCFCKCKGT
ncbi:hypothetical protein KI387_032769, partial [Taxus chinensis]